MAREDTILRLVMAGITITWLVMMSALFFGAHDNMDYASFTRVPGLAAPAVINARLPEQWDRGALIGIVRPSNITHAKQNVEHFFDTMRAKRLETTRKPPLVGAFMHTVGLRGGGRSTYDLWWFASEPDKVYAVDLSDPALVYIAELGGADAPPIASA